MLGEVARDELDLSGKLDVLFVKVVAVEAFEAIDMRLRTDRERPRLVLLSSRTRLWCT